MTTAAAAEVDTVRMVRADRIALSSINCAIYDLLFSPVGHINSLNEARYKISTSIVVVEVMASQWLSDSSIEGVNNASSSTQPQPVTELDRKSVCQTRLNQASHFWDEERRNFHRLLARLELWKSRREMMQHNSETRQAQQVQLPANQQQVAMMVSGEQQASSSGEQEQAVGESSRRVATSCQHQMRDQLILTPICSGNLSFATVSTGANLEQIISEKKLWQTLVLPFVLGSIIFLVAIWSHQISLALMSDTMTMILIVGSVFIVMSAMAYWLSYDRPLTESAEGQQSEQHRYSGNLPNCCHHLHDLETQLSSDHHQHHHESCDKCYRVSIIDFQPPDYYSAMKNSTPVGLYLEENEKSLAKNTTNNVELNADVDDYQLSSGCSSPPKYYQLNHSSSNENV